MQLEKSKKSEEASVFLFPTFPLFPRSVSGFPSGHEYSFSEIFAHSGIKPPGNSRRNRRLSAKSRNGSIPDAGGTPSGSYCKKQTTESAEARRRFPALSQTHPLQGADFPADTTAQFLFSSFRSTDKLQIPGSVFPE